MYPYVCRQAFLSLVDKVDDRSADCKVYASKMAGGFQAGGVTFHRLVKPKRGVGMPSARHETPVKNGIRARFTKRKMSSAYWYHFYAVLFLGATVHACIFVA
jgi:hypothetical protein